MTGILLPSRHMGRLVGFVESAGSNIFCFVHRTAELAERNVPGLTAG